ncbi:MAG: cyclic 2,3-diphosphoglycerate synthase [Methanobacteriota archaeon]
MTKQKMVIIGAAGRDFHNFNVLFRGKPEFKIIAFTAAQIPDIDGRTYPPELAGKELYPQGIPIVSQDELPKLIKEQKVDVAVFSYSDVSYQKLMSISSIVNAAGADFLLIGAEKTMVKANVPVIAICAVRTGSGKSQTTRKVCKILKEKGKRVVAIRHPMPYGDLVKQKVQRFATYDDLDKHKCTIEEREEYEPHIDDGIIVYSGVDYGAILSEAEKEADVIVWDGGNNDTSFYKPDLYIVIADPLRPGHEVSYYPGETNLRLADVVIINKIDSADRKNVEMVRDNIEAENPDAIIIEAESPITVESHAAVKGKDVLVVEDGPTLTHGEMTYGAGMVAARKYGAKTIVEPRPYAVGTIAATFEKYPHLKELLPAMGYGTEQVKDLQDTINKVPCDVVLAGTPIDLSRIIKINKPIIRVRYSLKEIGKPDLAAILAKF